MENQQAAGLPPLSPRKKVTESNSKVGKSQILENSDRSDRSAKGLNLFCNALSQVYQNQSVREQVQSRAHYSLQNHMLAFYLYSMTLLCLLSTDLLPSKSSSFNEWKYLILEPAKLNSSPWTMVASPNVASMA